MTMHLLPPMYSTTGKKKGKAKHRNATSANLARKNAESWQALLDKWGVNNEVKTTKVRKSTQLDPVVRSTIVHDPKRSTRHIPSVDTGVGIAAKPADKVYTGDAMIGIGQLHKSNGIPVFRQEDAVDVSKMRRG